ncbi:hypothetical protein H5410_022868, partial [Solanum commersonii]
MPKTRSMASLKSSDHLSINTQMFFHCHSTCLLILLHPLLCRRSEKHMLLRRKVRRNPDQALLELSLQRICIVSRFPGRVVNLNQLRDSNCPISSFLKAQKLSLLFPLCGLELFEDDVRLFYANLRISSDNGELETLVLGNRLIINELLFEDVFGTKFFGVISYMNGAKTAVAEPGANLKGSLSNISNRDVFVLYCLLKKYRINWAAWFKEYMWESSEESNPSTSLPYGLLISQILVDKMVDLSMFTPIVINATYDSRTFSSMGYVESLMNSKLASRCGLESLHDAVEKVFRLQKDTSTNVGKLRISMTGIKQESISTINKLIRQVDSLKNGVDSSNNEPAISVQNSYSSLSKTVERSYNSFNEKVINTMKYFWGKI